MGWGRVPLSLDGRGLGEGETLGYNLACQWSSRRCSHPPPPHSRSLPPGERGVVFHRSQRQRLARVLTLSNTLSHFLTISLPFPFSEMLHRVHRRTTIPLSGFTFIGARAEVRSRDPNPFTRAGLRRRGGNPIPHQTLTLTMRASTLGGPAFPLDIIAASQRRHWQHLCPHRVSLPTTRFVLSQDPERR